MKIEILDQHRWLKQLAGEWTYETEFAAGPDQPPTKMSGTESARMLGDIWLIGEWTGPSVDGVPHSSVITLGFDSKLNRFVGTFIAPMMHNLWIYDGELDSNGTILTLESEGPKFTGEGTGKYRDSFEIIDPNHKFLRSEFLNDDGSWHQFMTTDFRRKNSN
jgi:hypothetical protein